jgi:hypothetical protein
MLPRGKHIEGLCEYVNIIGIHGALITSNLATLHELQSIYSAKDAYDLFELLSVNRYNERIINGNSN